MAFHLNGYSNFHELNIDWLLGKFAEFENEFSDLKIDWTNLENDWETQQQAFTDLQQFVTDYFDNLDVSEEINAKLEEMNEDGALWEIMKPYVDDQLDEIKVYVTPQMFGAAADGNTDDTNAIQAAVNDGRIVLFPTGVYLISDPINIPSNRYITANDGAVLKIKRTDNTWRKLSFAFGVYDDFTVTGYNGVHDVVVENLTLDGNYNTLFTSSGHGGGNFGLSHCKDIVIRNCTFKNMPNDHYIDIAGCENIKIEKCNFRDSYVIGTASYEAINIDWASEDGFPHFGAHDNSICINIHVDDCYFYNLKNYAYGIGTHYYPTGAGNHRSIKITNCSFNAVSGALHLMRCFDMIVSNNMIWDAGHFAAAQSDKWAMYFVNTPGLVVANNTFRDVIYGGITVQNATSGGYVNGVVIDDNVFSGINSANDNNYMPIYINWCASVHVESNVIRNTNQLSARVTNVTNLNFTNNSSSDATLEKCFEFSGLVTGHILFNTSNKARPYTFTGINRYCISQVNDETTINAVPSGE